MTNQERTARGAVKIPSNCSDGSTKLWVRCLKIALDNFARMFGMQVSDFEEIPIHSGSIRVTMQKNLESRVSDKVKLQIIKEIELGLYDVNYFLDFKNRMAKQL